MSRAAQIEELAAHWVLRREERSWDEADEAQFAAWMDESDAHKVAFWRLENGWRAADRIASIGAPPRLVHDGFRSIAWTKPLALAASLLLVFTLIVMQTGLPFGGTSAPLSSAKFETGVGGHKVVSLGDGSRVELNTDTIIKAAVDEDSRAVWLHRGEAFFDVAKQPGQKFVIYAGARTITVLGTKFSVRRNGAEVVVAVLEGRVRVEDAPAFGADREATITAGDIAIAKNGNTVVTKSAEAVQSQLAWREGLLKFDGVTLASAAQQFNRYNRKQLVIGDVDASGLLIEGIFRARNVDAFARLLQNAYGLNVQDESGRFVLSSRRMASKTLPKQIRPELLAPQRASDAATDTGPDCGTGGSGCAVIPLSAPAPRVQTASQTTKAIREGRNWDVLHKLYPARALAAGEEGLVGFTVRLDSRGNPMSCKITHTSGHPLLDMETCKLILVNAVFKKPAGVTGSQQRAYEGVVNWKLPTTPLTAVPAVPKVIAEAQAPEELVCKRVQRTGSNIPSERQCMPKSEWLKASESSKRAYIDTARRNCGGTADCY
ncbi:FecR domain-containing protein [Sphingomonas lutea]|uniref:FecR domain-containing protein n=1 Tax=Sphingomonas lutea TaxID=1045317 RepID=A0A7G9SJR7_9SPHN|nr:FecR domain-containing protein [Sphingomonas lutea]QNN68092.1 FecR domain-containing protein [Sphingomonas lutea]